MAGFQTLGGGGGKGAWSLQVHTVGLDQINFIIKNMGKQLGRKAIMKALTLGAKPVVIEAKNNIRGHGFKGKKTYRTAHAHFAKGLFMTKIKTHKRGALLKSIGITKVSKLLYVFVGPRKGLQYTNDAWYAHFVEFGTDGYVVKKDKNVPGIGLIKAGTSIPGQRKKPFMRPAWDTQQKRAMAIIEDELGEIMYKFLKKHAPKKMRI